MLKNFKKFFIILSFIVLTSCNNAHNPNTSVSVDSQGVSVDVNGNSVNVSATGVSVNAGGLSLGDIALQNMNTQEVSELSDEEKSQFQHLSAEMFEVNNCNTQFNQLVKTFGNNYESCFATRKAVKACTSDRQIGKVNVAIILDASGSMGAMIGGESMMNIAKSEVKNYITSLDNAVGGSLIVYGHKGSSRATDASLSCGGIENFGSFSDKNTLVSRVDSLRATGWTPLAASLENAEKYLESISNENDQKLIVLISDGKETCGGNPIAIAQKIASKNNFFIDVIGFNVAGETQKELQQIALAGGGKYSDVRSRLDFQNVFADMKAFSREITCGASEASIVLRDATETLNTYYSCIYNLREEEAKIMTHITMSCEDDITTLMENRVQNISQKLKNLETDAKNRLDNFEKSIENVIEKF